MTGSRKGRTKEKVASFWSSSSLTATTGPKAPMLRLVGVRRYWHHVKGSNAYEVVRIVAYPRRSDADQRPTNSARFGLSVFSVPGLRPLNRRPPDAGRPERPYGFRRLVFCRSDESKHGEA